MLQKSEYITTKVEFVSVRRVKVSVDAASSQLSRSRLALRVLVLTESVPISGSLGS